MKLGIALLLAAMLALLGWLAAGPFMTVNAIREAIQKQDSAALSEHVDFPALRSNLRAQAEDLIARRAGSAQDNPITAIVLGVANSAAGSAIDALATPAGIGAVLEGRGLWHRITGGGIGGDSYSHASPPDLLRDAKYRFESPSRFTATINDADGDPVVFVLHRHGLNWKLDDIRMPWGDAAAATD
ncbi:DUF2939 domain-containing protein [Lysobacter niastensis]|uniref:DUF2939 domain-containing protein n=1 Tax=Lysobacter niastensis TaxID=380629 RepID=A0ABS0BCX2_9GAMM|nr:DUF2939 domain-containing protein [Lysobacter niastensis]MBF6025542.1 DUF2939 domain-containing protein [Lysobacter niastensis]